MKQGPIFIMAAAPRTGSTWLQRMLTSTGDVLIWGENHTLMFHQDWFEGSTEIDPDHTSVLISHYREHGPDMWMAVLQPEIDLAYVSKKQACESLFRAGAKREGYSRWGVKQTSWTPQVLDFIEWAWPRSTVIFIHRRFEASFASRFKGNATVQKGSRRRDIEYFVDLWLRQHRLVLERPKRGRRYVRVCYEELVADPLKRASLCDDLGLNEPDPALYDTKISVSGHKDVTLRSGFDLDVIGEERLEEIDEIHKMLGYSAPLQRSIRPGHVCPTLERDRVEIILDGFSMWEKPANWEKISYFEFNEKGAWEAHGFHGQLMPFALSLVPTVLVN